jgi:hypothetical protein
MKIQKKILTISTIISFFLLTSLSGNEFNIGNLKTGQTKSYTNYDDGHYQMGIDRTYTRDDSKNIVTDTSTNRMWQDDTDVGSIKKNWSDAKTYCTKLTLGGYTDWYLPSIEELVSITDKGRSYPSINSIFQNINSDDYFWSASTYIDNIDIVWDVHFRIGNSNYDYKTGSFYVRCARKVNN